MGDCHSERSEESKTLSIRPSSEIPHYVRNDREKGVSLLETSSFSGFFLLRLLWDLAVGEEGVGHYLRYLPPGGIVIGAEVWQVSGAARLALPST